MPENLLCAHAGCAKPRAVSRCLGIVCLASAWLCFGAMPALAAPPGVSTGDCEVLASGQLRGDEYVASYRGPCQGGKAQGQGRAEWQLRHSPAAAPVVWQGRFDQGVLLSEPAVKAARRVDSTRVLLDLGDFQGPGQRGHLWVESGVNGKLPALACQPLSLQVSTQHALHDDAVARQWLDAAYQHWQSACGGSLNALQRRNLRVQLREGDTWAPDAFGNLPAGVVQAVTPVAAGSAQWQSYTNRAAQARAAAAREQQGVDEALASQARVRAFARANGARRYVALDVIDHNPFRLGDDVLLVAVQMVEARSSTEGVVRAARRVRGDWTRALVQGPVASWDQQGRILAVRAKGRSNDKYTRDALVLQVIDSQRCEQADCADYLRMPGGNWLREEAL
ncbi:MAG: hypothetical protein Q4G71_04495 [Pseudomonadota bacterium]|nr:hypothetical protein [Pseudomonadota bacterium]